METLGIIVVVSVIIYFSVLSYKRTASRKRGEQALDIASVWLNKNGIDRNKVRFFSYSQDALVSSPGATVVVGKGVNAKGRDVGFVIETHPILGVVAGHIIGPTSASFHSQLSRAAIQHGRTLMDVLLAEHKLRKERGMAE
jgi:hypothetical protein